MKKRNEDALTEKQQAALDAAKRLKAKAYDLGLLSKTQKLSTNSLELSKALIKCDGKDIVKKGTVRKNRFLLVFNFQLAPAAAGKMGTLAQLDTRNPVMYLDFPSGRLKLFGTLAFPKNKYMLLRPGGKDVLAEDILESMIVFSEAWWVGRREDNPEERRLPLPPELSSSVLHENYSFVAGASAAGTGGPVKALPGGVGATVPGGSARSAGLRVASDDSDGDDDDDDDDDDEGDFVVEEPARQPQPPSSSRPRRAATREVKYTEEQLPEVEGDSSNEGGDSSDDDDGVGGCRPKGAAAAAEPDHVVVPPSAKRRKTGLDKENDGATNGHVAKKWQQGPVLAGAPGPPKNTIAHYFAAAPHSAPDATPANVKPRAAGKQPGPSTAKAGKSSGKAAGTAAQRKRKQPHVEEQQCEGGDEGVSEQGGEQQRGSSSVVCLTSSPEAAPVSASKRPTRAAGQAAAEKLKKVVTAPPEVIELSDGQEFDEDDEESSEYDNDDDDDEDYCGA